MYKRVKKNLAVFLIVSIIFCSIGVIPFGNISKVQAATLSITQTKLGNIFYDSEQKSFIINTDGDSIAWQISDYWGVQIATGSQPVSDGTTTLTVNPGKYGYFKLVISAKSGGVVTATKETSFAIVSNFDLSTVTSSPFSAQTHTKVLPTDSIYSDPEVISLLNRMGVKTSRDGFLWEEWEKSKGVYTPPSWSMTYLQNCTTNNMFSSFVINRGNNLYDGGDQPYTDAAIDAEADFAIDAISKNPSVVKYVEVWNEPNVPGGGVNPDPSRYASVYDWYVNLLQRTYQKIKAAYPNVKVYGIVSAGGLGSGSLNWIEKIFVRGGLNYMDGVAVHDYNENPELIKSSIKGLENLIKKYNYGNLKPVYISETGFTTATGRLTETQQAQYLVRKLTEAITTPSVEMINIYNFHSRGLNPNEQEDNWGVVRHVNDPRGKDVPKPAYASYATLTRQLTGATFQATDTITNNAAGLISERFSKAGVRNNTKRAMWSTVASTKVALNIGAGNSIDVTDIMGNVAVYTAGSDGNVSLVLSKDMVYVDGTVNSITDVGVSVYVDNSGSGFTTDSAWTASTASDGYYGSNYMHDGTATADTANRWAKWTPDIATPGLYDIFINWSAGTNRPDAAPLEIKYNGGLDTTKTVNQTINNGEWVNVGTYDLAADGSNYVKLYATDVGYTIADAVLFKKVLTDDLPTPTPTPTATPTPTVMPTPTPTPGSSPTYLVNDDFNSMTTGSAPAGWTLNTAGGTIAVQDIPSSSDKSMKLNDTSTSAFVSTSKTFTSSTADTTLEYKTMLAQTTDTEAIYIQNSSGTAAVTVAFDYTGNIYSYYGSTKTNIQTYTANTWYTIKVIARPSTNTFDIYINGVLKASNKGFQNAVTSLDKVQVKSSAATMGTVYYDNVQIYY